MRREAASDWIGVSVGKFDEMVRDGRMPQPKRIDGCVIWDRYRIDEAFDAIGDNRAHSSERNPAYDTAPDLDVPRRFGDRLGKVRQSAGDPLMHSYELWEAGKITIDQLPSGIYPNGMRVYADGEWEAIVRSSAMQKREVAALGIYFQAKGTTGYFKGAGPGATERLAARGYVEVVEARGDDRLPYYGITSAGESAWIQIAQKSTTK
jgi:predicted DNA-binding transcriptional regulator AlpA